MMFQAIGLSTVDPTLQIGATILGLAIAIIFHEVAHGVVALRLGDPTAYLAGRLSLNPLKHVDMLGTIIIPFLLIATNAGFVFGWAKPVPVNYFNLRYGRYGPVLVALAGPFTNLLIMIVGGILARVSPVDTALPFLFATITMINGVLLFFNLIPIPPLDGSKILYIFLENRPDAIAWLEKYGFFVLLGLLILGGNFLGTFVFGPAVSLSQFLTGIPLL